MPYMYKSKDHLAQCALHPRQVDSLGPSGMQGGQLGHNEDPTEDPHGPHKAGDKPLSNKCCKTMRMKIKGGFQTFGRQHNEMYDIVSWAYFTVVMMCCYLHLPITCNQFPEPEQNIRAS